MQRVIQFVGLTESVKNSELFILKIFIIMIIWVLLL